MERHDIGDQLADLSAVDLGLWLGVVNMARHLGLATPDVEAEARQLARELARREPDQGDPPPPIHPRLLRPGWTVGSPSGSRQFIFLGKSG
jgi:hypothetical protein